LSEYTRGIDKVAYLCSFSLIRRNAWQIEDTTFGWHWLCRVGMLVVYRIRADAKRECQKGMRDKQTHAVYKHYSKITIAIALHLYIADNFIHTDKKHGILHLFSLTVSQLFKTRISNIIL